SIELEDAFEMGKQHLDLLPLAARLEILGRAGEASGDLARSLMHASRHLAARLSGTASGLEGAGLTVGLAGSVEPHVVFGHAGPRGGEGPAVLGRGFSSWRGVGVGA